HPVAARAGGRVDRDHAAVLGHVLGELGGADLRRGIDDVLLVAGDQRTHHQHVGGRVDHRQVGQGLAGHLADRLAGHQGLDLQTLGDLRGGAQHHALEDHAHLAVVDLAENLADHFLERHADEQYALRTAELLPQVVGDFHHTQLVGTATEIEEAEMGDQAAAHHLVGRHGGVEATAHQHQGLLQRTQRVAAQAFVPPVHDEQALVADLQAHFHFRLLQVDAGRRTFLTQAAADMAFDVDGAERMLAAALAAHRKNLARQLVRVVALAVLGNVVQIAQRVFVDFEKQADTRGAAQALGHFRQQLRIVEVGLHLKVVPDTRHLHGRIEVAQHAANVLPQLADELLAYRTALDGDFRENFNDQLHGEEKPVPKTEKQGRGL